MYELLIFLVWLLASFQVSSASPDQKAKALVDLGYAKHIPTYTNTTTSGKKISVYKNIRFANSPTGNLRFRLPDTRLAKVKGIQDGNVPEFSNHCISSAPKEAPFSSFNGTTWGQEDCLFLDVYVPEGIRPGDDVPVLHWFVGSAFAFGSKEMYSTPLGLFDVMGADTKFIFVANNYRLGVPGWTYLPGEDMVANLGMHDCLAAAKWTSKYISRFGGDPGQVTVMGQSAGAGIIGLLSVLKGGKGKLPFQRTVMSSPAIPPRRDPIERQKKLFGMILEAANCTTLECLRSAPESTILDVNGHLINDIPSDAGGGLFGPAPGFGPVLDGHYIPDMPQALFQKGQYHKKLQAVMVGNVANEGMGTSSDVGMPEAFGGLVRRIFRTASNETIAYIQSHYDFADNAAKLAWDWTTDVIFGCNAANIASAYRDVAKRYIYSVPPAAHGHDLWYIFYLDQETTPLDDPEAARKFQRSLLDFLHGREITWPTYGSGQEITNITESGFESVPLPDDLRARCEMINKISLDPANGA